MTSKFGASYLQVYFNTLMIKNIALGFTAYIIGLGPIGNIRITIPVTQRINIFL